MTQSTPPDFTTPLKVVVSFNYTIGDLREGLGPSERMRKRRLPWQIGASAWLIFIVLSSVLYLLLRQNAPRLPAGLPAALPSTPPPQLIDARLIAVPSITAALCITILILSLFLTARLSRSKSKAIRARASLAFFFALVACGALMWAATTLLGTDFAKIEIDPATAPIGLIAFAPSIFVFAVLVLLTLTLPRAALKRQWARPSFQRRRTIELSESGVRNADELGETNHKWPYFARAWETVNELVLVDESDLRHILPKRAFEEVGGLDTARSLIGSHIAESKFLTQPVGFPVRPIAVPPPIPRTNL